MAFNGFGFNHFGQAENNFLSFATDLADLEHPDVFLCPVFFQRPMNN